MVLEDNRDEEDQDHYDGLGGQLDEISEGLIDRGDKDGANFPERAKHIADTIPGAELVLIPGIGHVPHFEAPDLFYKALLKFLNSDATMPAQKTAPTIR